MEKNKADNDAKIGENSELIGPANAEMSEAYSRLLGKLADDNPETRKMMSDLTPEQIRLLTITYTKALILEDHIAKAACEQFVQFRHSKNRLSRREVVELSGAIRDQQKSGHWWNRLFNREQ